VALVGLGASHFVPVSSINRSLVALLIPLMLLPGILYPKTIFARVLEWSGLRWIGRISYSLYIWQGLFTGNERRMLWGAGLWPVNFCAMLGTAVASYYLLERPIIRWGHRTLRPVTHGRRDLA
jgi:peptidoglycan/LPS O-acetylase OafA/YrhL